MAVRAGEPSPGTVRAAADTVAVHPARPVGLSRPAPVRGDPGRAVARPPKIRSSARYTITDDMQDGERREPLGLGVDAGRLGPVHEAEVHEEVHDGQEQVEDPEDQQAAVR